MEKSTRFCNWICQYENCKYHLYSLENKSLSKEEIDRYINTAEKKKCPHYGSTKGMCVPMCGAHME